MLNKRILGLAAFAGLAGSSLAVGPVGLWMLTDGDSMTDALIQGGSVNTYAQAAGTTLQYPIAYHPTYDLFMTVGRDAGGVGGVYDPAHNLVTLFTNYSSESGQHLDGTLDTLRMKTYAVNYSNGDVLRYGDDLFNTPTSIISDGPAGSIVSLTYHMQRDSLFVGGDGVITEMDVDGNVLGSFATPDSWVRSLAYDASDNTMWYLTFDSDDIVQIDASGTELQRVNVNLGGNYWGGEIRSVVPEPATMAVLGVGAAALVRRRRK